jgi:transporter family protein
MQLWFAFAMIDAFLFGSDAIFAKLSTPKLGVPRIAVLIAVVDGTIYLAGFYFWRGTMNVTLWSGTLATVSCIVGATGYLCFFESLGDTQIAVTGTISAAYPALTIVGAILFLSETLTTIQTVGLAAIIGGIAALSYGSNHKSDDAIPRRSILFALLAFILWGFWGLTSKMAIDVIGPGSVFGFYVVASAIVPLGYLCFRKVRPSESGEHTPPLSAWALGTASLAANAMGVLAFTFALATGLASLVVPVSSAYPVVTVLLAVALLHERLTTRQTIALVFTLIGLMLVAVTV